MEKALSKCDHEPAHLIPLIQNVGVLIAFRSGGTDSSKVLQVSANCQAYGLPNPEELLGASFFSIFASETADLLQKLLDRNVGESLQRPCTTRTISDPSQLPRAKDYRAGDEKISAWWEEFYTNIDAKLYLDALNENRNAASVIEGTGGLLFNGIPVVVRVFAVNHGSRELLVAEIENAKDSGCNYSEIEKHLVDLGATWRRLHACLSLEDMHDEITLIIAEELKYDRTMFYKFNENLDGSVVSEVVSAQSQLRPKTFKGLRFPASDIPKQARALMQRAVVRHTFGITRPPVELVPSVIDRMPLDLTDSRFRQGSLLHVKYLRNMGVESTTIIAITVAGRLYGMVACHNSEAKQLTSPVYQKLKLISSVMQASVEQAMNQRRRELLAVLEKNMIPRELSNKESPDEVLRQISFELCNILQARCLWIGTLSQTGSVTSSRSTFGNTTLSPRVSQQILQVILSELPVQSVLTLSSVCTDAPKLWKRVLELEKRGEVCASDFCGLAVIRSSTFILVFVRAAVEQEMSWAGEETTSKGARGTNILKPRHSFEKYLVKYKHRSAPWSTIDQDMMEYLYSPLLVMLQEVYESKKSVTEAFISRMSHELRTPFNAILGTLELIAQERGLPQYTRSLLQTATLSTECILSILDDILLLSKSEARSVELDKKIFHLDDFLGHLRMLFGQGEKKACKVSVQRIGESSDLLFGDGLRLLQVFINLISNAVKFGRGEDDHVEVTARTFTGYGDVISAIRVSRFAGANKYVTSHTLAEITEIVMKKRQNTPVYLYVSVKDNGIGVSQSDLHLLFQPFQQVITGEVKSHQGTGLGLSICSSLCATMDGIIWCSIPEDESTFGCSFDFVVQLSFPTQEEIEKHGVQKLQDLFTRAHSRVEFHLKRHQASIAPDVQNSGIKGVHAPPTHTRDKVLIAEDNETNLMLLQGMVKKVLPTGTILVARDGIEAVHIWKLHAGSIMCCLFDLHMPEASGLDAAREGK